MHFPSPTPRIPLVLTAALMIATTAWSQGLPNFSISGVTAVDDQHPCVAYDVSTDRYLVVWERIWSATSVDIFGRLVNANGSFASAVLRIGTGGFNFEPAVANVNLRNAFLVTYTRAGRIYAHTVAAADGATSLEVEVAGTASSVQHFADLGGETSLADDTALCVWKSDGDHAVLARELGINADLSVRVSASTFTVAGANHETPRISRGCGTARRYAVVTSRVNGPSDQDPYVTIVDNRGQPLMAPTALSTAAVNEITPTVDGDGTNWVAAWTQVPSATDRDVVALAFSFDGATGALVRNSPATFIAATRSIEDQPTVCWTGGSCLVGFAEQFQPGIVFSAFRSVEPFGCTTCQGTVYAYSIHDLAGPPQIASRVAGGSARDETLVVWEVSPFGTTNGDVFGALWSPSTGDVAQVASACGRGGTCHAPCARLGNAGFAFRLREAAPVAPTFLLLSAARLDLPCGVCQYVPDASRGLVFVTGSDFRGNASLGIPLPTDQSLLNVLLYAQWGTLVSNSPACPAIPLDLSTALQLRLER